MICEVMPSKFSLKQYPVLYLFYFIPQNWSSNKDKWITRKECVQISNRDDTITDDVMIHMQLSCRKQNQNVLWMFIVKHRQKGGNFFKIFLAVLTKIQVKEIT